MATPVTRRVKQVVNPPDSVDGEVVEIDTGYERTLVVTVEKDGDIYYETYELANVEKANPAR